MTKTPNRTSSELAIAELRIAQKKLAKALVHVLGLGHTFNGNTLNRLIREVGEIADSFEDPATTQMEMTPIQRLMEAQTTRAPVAIDNDTDQGFIGIGEDNV